MSQKGLWKNYSICEELDIAGSFVFDGLKTLDEVENFSNSQDLFKFFYFISVGIERLLKITLVLLEDDLWIDREEFEKRIKHHDHHKILERIKKKHVINFGKQHNEFLKILSQFYENNRYGRFEIFSNCHGEKKKLQEFLNNLSDNSDVPKYFEGSSGRGHIVPQRVKKFLGKTIGKITTTLFEIIQKESHRLNLYTYETRVCSKAQKIFLGKSFDFEKEHLLSRELFTYLFNNKKDPLLQEVEKITPLDFDIDSISEVFECFDSDLKKQFFVSQMEEMQCEEGNERLNFLKEI
jgi:hypothetical protein